MDSWALITGASTGIGRELAKVFARHGFKVVLSARNEARLQEVAAELREAHKTESMVLPADLAKPEAPHEIFAALRNTPVSVLVNNAGFGNHGPFAATSLALQKEMMQVNMTALVELTHLFVQAMLTNRAGRILNVASTAAFQPGPTMNVYYASKAFVYAFSYALAEELAGTGVSVTALCPGMTRTEFMERAHLRPRGWLMMEARQVAETGYRGMMKGKRVVIPGLLNQVGAFFAKRVPARLTSAVVKRIH
jgi:short-subunit dehydrogenase